LSGTVIDLFASPIHVPTLLISLSPSAEARLRQQATARGYDVGLYAASLIEQAVNNDDNVMPSADQRRALWRAWVQSHAPVHHIVDDSRDAIYEVRGE
jgi:hypothetical protein